MANADTRQKIAPNTGLREPSMFKVIYLNDEVTSMDFVINSLVSYFNYTKETAFTITQNIHTEGAASVAVLPYEIAEQRGIEVTMDARAQGYPLQVKVEPETA
jgi:ATP-dependent Clp protease adaptor protein ClpS